MPEQRMRVTRTRGVICFSLQLWESKFSTSLKHDRLASTTTGTIAVLTAAGIQRRPIHGISARDALGADSAETVVPDGVRACPRDCRTADAGGQRGPQRVLAVLPGAPSWCRGTIGQRRSACHNRAAPVGGIRLRCADAQLRQRVGR